MSALLKFEQKAYWQECCTCGITFGLLDSWDDRLRESHQTFYCPNGHSQSYRGENEAEKLRKELEEAQRHLEWQRNVAKNARIQQTRAQNKLKRITKRLNAGVCPHCNRTFKQLAAHMHNKHHDLVHEQTGTELGGA